VNFITDNLSLIAIAVISGGALLFPNFIRRGAKISQLNAVQRINQGKTLILDVRSTEEFAAGHMLNAKHISLKELPDRLAELEKSKKTTVITVCESGVRSGTAASILAKAGFEDVLSLDGGMAEWKKNNMPVTKK
jgi:rhodanese-related sulfurtransferase